MKFAGYLTFAAATAIAAAAPPASGTTTSAASAPTIEYPCTTGIKIPVSIEATNKKIPPGLSFKGDTPAEIKKKQKDLKPTKVSGHYTLEANLCSPSPLATITPPASRADVLQVLVHGATFTKEYWTAGGPAGLGSPFPGDAFSWQEYMTAYGYYTLSVDRLCNGNSSHPNGTTICQIGAEAAALKEVVKAAREGCIPGIKKKFSKIVWVGHSVGSTLANYIAQTDPDFVDAYVLTGFTSSFANSIAAESNFGNVPAQKGEPAVYGNLHDNSYFVSTNYAGYTEAFFYGNYTQNVTHYTYAHRGTATAGEMDTTELGQFPAPGVKGPLQVITGENDKAFCTRNYHDSNAPGNCGYGPSSLTAKTKELFPNSKFNYTIIPQTGHALNLHETAQDQFAAAQVWMQSHGF